MQSTQLSTKSKSWVEENYDINKKEERKKEIFNGKEKRGPASRREKVKWSRPRM